MNTRKKTIIAAITTAVLLCAGGCTAKAEQWRSKREAMQNSVVLINTLKYRRVRKLKLWLLGRKHAIS